MQQEHLNLIEFYGNQNGFICDAAVLGLCLRIFPRHHENLLIFKAIEKNIF
jgi:hypothetical protein